MSNYVYKYFPFISKIKYSQLKIDEVGLYSISTPKNAEIISNLIMRHFITQNIIITDAMAGVGGNTLSFAHNFFFVNSIEINSQRFNYLVSNVDLYLKKNVLCIKGNYLDMMHKVYQDVIFMDPPWGGKTYKEKNDLIIEISGRTLESICEEIRLFKLCKMIVLKLPLNYCVTNFSEELKNNLQIEKLKKMQILMFLII